VVAGMNDEPTWAAETLEEILQHSLPPIEDRPHSPAEVQRLRLAAAELAVFNDRAAVLKALDTLARKFAAAGRTNTSKAVRETAAAIDARWRNAP
jgi:hypothetical protein